jgi:8-oxo-dGTP pyrophosphatase MutT (NUDIX family)
MLDQLLEKYLAVFPNEAIELTLLRLQIEANDALDNRKTLPGHITGSAFILSPDRTKLLLVKHKILQTWFQPGGHWDPGESDPLVAARREAKEETSVEIADYVPLDIDNPLVPMDIDSHIIPENPNKAEPEHYHHDFRYVFVAASELFAHQAAEVDDIGWFAFTTSECQALGILQKLTNSGIV